MFLNYVLNFYYVCVSLQDSVNGVRRRSASNSSRHSGIYLSTTRSSNCHSPSRLFQVSTSEANQPGPVFYRRETAAVDRCRHGSQRMHFVDIDSIVRLKPISQLRFDYSTITIRRYHDAFDYDGSDRNYDLRSIQLRYDYDTTTTKN